MHRVDLEQGAGAIAAALRAGEVIALPTETLIGLSCRADDAAAQARITALKGIATARGFVALVHDVEVVAGMLARGCDQRIVDFLRAAWPAPLSAIVAVETPVPWGVERDGMWTAAIRVPADATLRRILAAVGVPVLSTSANRTGEPPCNDAADVIATFGTELDLVVESVQRPQSSGQASTLVDATRWPLRVVRRGAFDVERALEAIAP